MVTGADGTPQLTSAEVWEAGTKPTSCLNVGVTATGLLALGLHQESLATFPDEFVQGAAHRAEKVGDVDASAPEHWRDSLGDAGRVHLMWTIHALDSRDEIDRVAAQLESAWTSSGAFRVTSRLDGATLDTYTNNDDDRDTVHFGYRDSISQPRFVVDGGYVGRADSQPIASVGAVLLGRVKSDGYAKVPGEHYRTSFPGVAWQMPEADDGAQRIELGVNGCFNVFRVLEQDVHAFEQFLETAAQQVNAELDRRRKVGGAPGPAGIVWDKERVAAKLMGRWRNGVPLSLSHWTKGGASAATFPGPGLPPAMDQADLNDFDYPDDVADLDDFLGVHCPMGSHIRRANPRGARIVQRSAELHAPARAARHAVRPAVRSRPTRRRAPAGPARQLHVREPHRPVRSRDVRLDQPRPPGSHAVTGTNDPIIGANRPDTSRFEIPLPDAEPIVLTGFRRFTETVGSIYLFCPSVTALRFLAGEQIATR